jgi:chemotaxis protein MotA
MNISLGAAFVLGIVLLALTVFKDIGITMIFNVDAFLIVIGGTAIAMFIGFPVQRIRDTFHDIINTFSEQRKRDDIIRDILEISRMHRRADIRNLESRIQGMDDNYLKLAANLLINDHEQKEIISILEREMMLRRINCNLSQNVLKTVARLTPSFGLAGTVISLIKMFKHLESVDAIAPLMAVALMSTFYGVIIANLFMLPLCAKLKEKAIMDETNMHITTEGILAIKNREHPLKIEEMLRGFQGLNESSLQDNVAPQTVPKTARLMYWLQKVRA